MQAGTKRSWRVSNRASVREAKADDEFEASRPWGSQVSYGEQIALRGHADLEEVASAAGLEVRSTAEDQFLERLRRGEVAAFEQLVAEHTGDVYALLYRMTADPEEARDLTKRGIKFKQERGRPPSITATDPWERRMAEGVAFLAKKTAESKNG